MSGESNLDPRTDRKLISAESKLKQFRARLRLPESAAFHGARDVNKATRQFRALVEAAVVAEHGEVSLAAAATVQAAAEHHRGYLTAQAWLRNDYESLATDVRLALLKEISRLLILRDKALATLRLPLSGDSSARLNAALESIAAATAPKLEGDAS